MIPAEFLDVVLFDGAKTESGTILQEGAVGTMIGVMGEGSHYIIEFSIPDAEDEEGHRFETALLSAEEFAITGKSE